MPTVVSPRAYLSRHARVGGGTTVMHEAIVNCSAEIGENCIINTKALVEHDAKVGNHTHIATGVRKWWSPDRSEMFYWLRRSNSQRY